MTGSITITGNFLGTTPQGGPLTGSAPQNRGVYALGAQSEAAATDVTVGGPNPADRNLISGHTSFQLSEGIRSQFYTRFTVQGNLIGVDATASYTISNGIGIFCGSTPPPRSAARARTTATSSAAASRPASSPAPRSSRAISSGPIRRRRATSATSAAASSTASRAARSAASDRARAMSSRQRRRRSQQLPGRGQHPGQHGHGARQPLLRKRPRRHRPRLHSPNPADPGDADTGPNGRQNAPIITGITYGPPTVVHAILSSAPSTIYDVDFYANLQCVTRPTAYPEGEEFAGTIQATTNPSGVATIDFQLPSPLAPAGGLRDRHGSRAEHVGVLAGDPPEGRAALGPGRGRRQCQALGPAHRSRRHGRRRRRRTIRRRRHAALHHHSLDAGLRAGHRAGRRGHESGRTRRDARERLRRGLSRLPPANIFHDDIVKLVASQVTVGVGGGLYGVDDPVKRQSMAVFVVKAEHGICYTPPACVAPGTFADVPCPSPFADWIYAMAAEGITGGCGGGNFCPLNTVRRDQMAPFLLKAVHGPEYQPPGCVGVFADVACPSLFADWIEQLKAENVTSGCGNGRLRTARQSQHQRPDGDLPRQGFTAALSPRRARGSII